MTPELSFRIALSRHPVHPVIVSERPSRRLPCGYERIHMRTLPTSTYSRLKSSSRMSSHFMTIVPIVISQPGARG